MWWILSTACKYLRRHALILVAGQNLLYNQCNLASGCRYFTRHVKYYTLRMKITVLRVEWFTALCSPTIHNCSATTLFYQPMLSHFTRQCYRWQHGTNQWLGSFHRYVFLSYAYCYVTHPQSHFLHIITADLRQLIPQFLDCYLFLHRGPVVTVWP